MTDRHLLYSGMKSGNKRRDRTASPRSDSSLFHLRLADPHRRVGRFFFFQAEDGIRVLYVTGVQTCALPIFRTRRAMPPSPNHRERQLGPFVGRSEERRVGKECRSRWSPYHSKKKKTKQ